MSFDGSFREDPLIYKIFKNTVFIRDRIRCGDDIKMDFGKTRIKSVG